MWAKKKAFLGAASLYHKHTPITSSPRQEKLFIWPPFFQYKNVFCAAKNRVGHA